MQRGRIFVSVAFCARVSVFTPERERVCVSLIPLPGPRFELTIYSVYSLYDYAYIDGLDTPKQAILGNFS